jgi:tRNA threonylcarbamoyladenosine biosynthesis protein TsaB
MLLALDTSNDYAGVALWDEHGLRGEANWFAGRRHTEQLLPQVDLLLQHLGGGPDRLTAIAVATGPGSWSGLRAGMSLAKAIAVGRGLPIIGIPTLDALAYGQHVADGIVAAMVRLGRDRFGMALYDVGDGQATRRGSFQTMTANEVAGLTGAALLVGDVPVEARQPSSGVRGAPATEHQRRAAFVAELAWERHLRGAHDDLIALEPIYLSSPVRTDEKRENG